MRVGAEALAAAATRSGARAGADALLDACADPEVQRIVLLDAPAVLGWERWREIGGATASASSASLQAAIDAGTIARQPVAPLAHVLIGALDEAALYVARADDPDAARAEVAHVLHRLRRVARLTRGSAQRRAPRAGPPRRGRARPAGRQPDPVGGAQVEVELEQRHEHEAARRPGGAAA